MITDKAFWIAAGERAVKTFAQSLVALIGVGAVGITHIDWAGDLSVAATAGVLSVLTSLSSVLPINEKPALAPAPAAPAPTEPAPPAA